MDEIEENIPVPIDVDELAKAHDVSSYYLKDVFFVPVWWEKYVQDRRLTLIGYDVVDTKQPILDIALSYCCDSNEGFTKALSRFRGITPLKARKKRANLHVLKASPLLKPL